VPIDRDSRLALARAAAALAEAGATVTAVEPPAGLEELVDLWGRLVLPIILAGLDKDTFAGFAAAVDGTPVAEGEDDTVRRLRAITARHRDWLAADEHRQRLRARFAAFFADHDVLLAPVMPTAAFPHDTERDMLARTLLVDGVERPYLDGVGWNGAIGALLLPVAVPPVGRTPDGLPIGVQVIAPHLEDRTAISVAAHLEDLLGGFVPPPDF
jgi:amidase